MGQALELRHDEQRWCRAGLLQALLRVFSTLFGVTKHALHQATKRSVAAAMMRELYDASTRSIFCFALATASSFPGVKVRSVDREISGKSARVA